MVFTSSIDNMVIYRRDSKDIWVPPKFVICSGCYLYDFGNDSGTRNVVSVLDDLPVDICSHVVCCVEGTGDGPIVQCFVKRGIVEREYYDASTGIGWALFVDGETKRYRIVFSGENTLLDDKSRLAIERRKNMEGSLLCGNGYQNGKVLSEDTDYSTDIEPLNETEYEIGGGGLSDTEEDSPNDSGYGIGEDFIYSGCGCLACSNNLLMNCYDNED
jgi:hypothetical protein